MLALLLAVPALVLCQDDAVAAERCGEHDGSVTVGELDAQRAEVAL